MGWYMWKLDTSPEALYQTQVEYRSLYWWYGVQRCNRATLEEQEIKQQINLLSDRTEREVLN